MDILYIYDCSAGRLFTSQGPTLAIGNASICAAQIDVQLPNAGLFMLKNGTCQFYPAAGVEKYFFKAEPVSGGVALEYGKPHFFSMAGGLFIAALGSEQMQPLFAACNPDSWIYFDRAQNAWNGPHSAAHLYSIAGQIQADTYLVMAGMNDCMCQMHEFVSMGQRRFSTMQQQPGVQSATVPADNDAVQRERMFTQAAQQPEPVKQSKPVIDEEGGKYVCPTCWLHFNAGDVMSIACHPDLIGDEVLGRDMMRRFWASRFNARGQALDEMGLPCPEMACPHCRRKLPADFLTQGSHIFSIIGAPSSGKSYYLSSLIHEMERTMGTEFNVAWRDADPTGNAMLNDVMLRLFSASTPEQASLSKTDLEGALYEEFYRHGRMVKLPKPFIYNVSRLGSRQLPASLVFYDNAGEHFEPGRNSADSPGAQHVAVAQGLFFLFDPTTSMEFKRFIGEKDDPQLHSDTLRIDQQHIIMAETSARISNILNLPPGEPIKTPLAVMVGKCDLWEEFLGENALRPIIQNGQLSKAAVDANSAIVRAFLMKMHPTLCTTAESLSNKVRYFAISQTGCSPVSFADPLTGGMKIGPDPKKIAPRRVCEPTLWVLSQLEPKLIPSF